MIEKRGEVILPQPQEATGEIWRVGHRADYTPWPQSGKRALARRRVFDEAIAAKQCIVVERDVFLGETPRT
jgi:hypothetical protein